MPSPIAHAAAGVAIHRLIRRRATGRVRLMLFGCVFLSLLPDADAAVGILLGNLGRYHNNFASAPLFGLLVALVIGALFRRAGLASFRGAFALSFACYQLHILMDFFTVGRGLMILWPFSIERVQPPFHLFYGLRWSDGLVSERHWITIFSELIVVGILFAALWWTSRRSATDPRG